MPRAFLLSRRRFLQQAGAVLVAQVPVAQALARQPSLPQALIHRGLFTCELWIPPVMAGSLDASGVRHYRLSMAPGAQSLVPHLLTPTWGYNGDYLGPTVRIPRGHPVHIHLHNGLNQSTTTHWHGAHVAGDMDGGPELLIGRGRHYDYHYTVWQPGASLWYHPHPSRRTGPHIYAGLAGMLLVDDGVDASLGLPHTYGVDDIPVIIQDRRLLADGGLAYMTHPHDVMGMKGDHILVNGREQPYWKAPAQWVRLRILNASNARMYHLAFADHRPFVVIASDAGLLERGVPVRQLLLAPAERVELLVDLRRDRGRSVVLQSDSRSVVPSLSANPADSDRLDRSVFPLLELRVSGRRGAPGILPDKLVTVPALIPRGPTRHFVLRVKGMGHGMQSPHRMKSGAGETGPSGPGGMSMGLGGLDMFSINKQYMSMSVINVAVTRGDTEIWYVANDSPMAHPFHYHGTSFQVLARDGKPPPAYERGWKDTVLVRRGETVKLIAPFHQPAGHSLPFMYHCHILEHEDNGMMGQFTVLDTSR